MLLFTVDLSDHKVGGETHILYCIELHDTKQLIFLIDLLKVLLKVFPMGSDRHLD